MFTDVIRSNSVSATSLRAAPINRRSNNHARLASAQAERAVGSKHGKKLRRRGDGKTCKIRSTGDKASIQQAAVSTESASATGSAWAWSESSSTAAADALSTAADSYTADVTSIAAPTSTSEASSPQGTEASSSSSSQAAVVTSTPASGSAGSSDKPFGLAWPNGDWDGEGTPGYVGQYVGPRTGWYYNWSPQPCSKADALGLEFVPMLWGPKDCNDQFWTYANSWSSNVKSILFFNEPNEISQSNVSPQDAVQYWKTYMTPMQAKGFKLGMAAVTNAPSGLEWIQQFIKLCPECHFDYIPVHWYATSTENFQEYLKSFNAAFPDKEIWITEYACQSFDGTPQCNPGQTLNLHQTMAGWFDAQPWITNYSPFGVMRQMQGVNEDNRLMDAEGKITALGDWYKNSA
ncbi:hypothetical protein QFC22_005724 [Naganishia vaughanmartiniae]|uniref:Uncharacterized protein n=1 Tax=Naganishia vaughanmartiniae TaxID=1424756 RepID=A0ACC2WUR5_9TREE|nr:hypothetical protein QFC22_005724 [Naganishia vaughanmartiniae]